MTDPTSRLNPGSPRSDKDLNNSLRLTPIWSPLTSHLGANASSLLWNGTNMLYPDYPLTPWLEQRFPLTRQTAYNLLDIGGLPE